MKCNIIFCKAIETFCKGLGSPPATCFFALIDMKHETDLFLFYDLTPSRIEIHVAMFSQQKPCLDRGGLTAPPQTCHVDIHTW